MTQSIRIHRFRKRYLTLLMSMSMFPAAHAMQELSDHTLSDTTGEGVALVLDNFKMVFQGPNDLSTGSRYARGINNPSQYDTGFIRLIPTGENYQQLSDRAFDKTYQPAYNAQYQTSYNTLKDAEYSRVYQTQLNNEYQRLRDIRYQEFRTAEFANTSGTLYKQRYDYWYDFHSGWAWESNYLPIWERADVAKTKANNDLNNVQEWKDALHTKVEGKLNESSVVTQLTNQATPVAETNSNNLAILYAQANVQQHTNQQISTAVNAASNMGNRKTKADMFIYGLALSKSDNDLNSRFSNQGFNWGSAENPWLIHAGTQKNIKQFTDTANDVGYIALEAPLMPVIGTDTDNNIKLGLWMDIFARDFNSSNAVDPITGGPVGGLDINERLRLQVVANGLSLHGSQVRLFQTLPSSDINYSETLGMASLIRLNTNDNPSTLTRSSSDLNAKGIRISTAALDNNSDGVGATPALNGSTAPIFNPDEGLYLYSPNINLVLGNMYQPFIVGSEDNNIILEVTRIPNISSIYNEIYQNYGGDLGTSDLKGSTCNVYQCGTPIKNHSTDAAANYQGRNATHSSISIGSVQHVPSTNRLRAIETPSATGIMFKNTAGDAVNLGSAVIDGVLIQHLKIKTTGL